MMPVADAGQGIRRQVSPIEMARCCNKEMEGAAVEVDMGSYVEGKCKECLYIVH